MEKLNLRSENLWLLWYLLKLFIKVIRNIIIPLSLVITTSTNSEAFKHLALFLFLWAVCKHEAPQLFHAEQQKSHTLQQSNSFSKTENIFVLSLLFTLFSFVSHYSLRMRWVNKRFTSILHHSRVNVIFLCLMPTAQLTGRYSVWESAREPQPTLQSKNTA